MITTDGKKHIIRQIAKNWFAEAIVLGVGATAETLDDYRLAFEAVRANVSTIGIDLDNNRIIIKAIIPSEVSGVFYEAGAYTLQKAPSSNEGISRMLFSQSESERWVGTMNSTNTRIGTQSIRLTPAANTVSATIIEPLYNLGAYSTADEFLLAYNSSGSVTAITLRLGTDATNYYQYSFAPTAGYSIKSFTKGSVTVTGTPDWNNITYVYVGATGTGTVDIDGLRIEDTDTLDVSYSLINRKVLPAPITKVAGVQMEVELPISINVGTP